jgi:hypothetical protein
LIYLLGFTVLLAFSFCAGVITIAYRLVQSEREAGRLERSELLTRIQHPNMVMVPEPDYSDPEPSESEEDDYNKVGQIMEFPAREESDNRIDRFKQSIGLDDNDG